MLLATLALAAPPSLRADERASVDRGDVIVHGELGEGSVAIVAMCHVDAPPSVVIEAILDVEALEGRVAGIQGVDIYLRDPDRVGARVVARSFGMRWTYSVIFTADRATNTVVYGLDPARPGDFARLDGRYDAWPDGSGTLLVNESSGDTTGWVPARIKAWFVERATADKLAGIRGVAEAGR